MIFSFVNPTSASLQLSINIISTRTSLTRLFFNVCELLNYIKQGDTLFYIRGELDVNEVKKLKDRKIELHELLANDVKPTVVKSERTVGRPKIAREIKDEIERLYRMNYPIKSIAEEVNLGLTSIYKIIRDNDLKNIYDR